MAQYLHVRCVGKTDRTSAHERIHSVGGVKPDGSPWIMTQDKAISYIEDGTYVFYIEKTGGLRLDVIVATSAHGSYGSKRLGTSTFSSPWFWASKQTCLSTPETK